MSAIAEWQKVKLLSCVWLFATPWTVTYQVPLTTGFSREEYWVGCLFLLQGNLPDPGNEPGSPSWQADALLSEQPGKLVIGRNDRDDRYKPDVTWDQFPILRTLRNLISSAGFAFTGYSELKPAAYCQPEHDFTNQHSSLIRLYFFWEILIQEDVCLMDFLKSIYFNNELPK